MPELDELLEKARAVGAEGAERAASTEKNRRLDDSVARALFDSGLLKVLGAQRHGGYELGFPEFVRVGRTLALYDVSLSWVYCIIGIHHWWGAFVEPEMQEELWGKDPDLVFVDSFAPTGKAEPERDGLRLSGRWGFLSGLPWAKWVAVGTIAALEPGAPPEYLMLFVPKSDYTVIDDWHTVGLRGSASASVEVKNVFVPRHRVFRMGYVTESGDAPGKKVNPGPLYRIPIVPGLGLALVSPSLGGAQAVARRFCERAATRVPLFQARRQAELVISQSVLAACMVELDALRQLLERSGDELSAIGRENRAVDKADRTRMFAWRAYIPRRSREIVAKLFDIAGARSIFEDEPLQRFWRDVNVMGQHVGLNYEAGIRNYGRTLLGLDPDAILY
jgi:3-hydroxy-9,10-secoandrosta-1,3,5(10)-triene-9,17-dione monooxygenase